MTNSLRIALLIGCVSLSHASLAQHTSAELLKEGYRRYGIESGIITYTLTGAQTGTETVVFDRWGLREKTVTAIETRVGNTSIATHTSGIMDGEINYAIDEKNKTITKSRNTILTEIAKTNQEKDLTALGESMMKRMGGKKTGSESFLRKRCDVWELKSLATTALVYKGITLRSKSTMGGLVITKTATNFEESAPVSKDHFAIPANMKIHDAGDPTEMLKKMKKKGKG